MHELVLKLFQLDDNWLRLTVSADLHRLPIWRMFVDELEGLTGVERVVPQRYSVDLGVASWITTIRAVAMEIGDEVFSGDIVQRLLEQRVVPLLSVTYIDELTNIRGSWETTHVH